jgi:hypothetical protein
LERRARSRDVFTRDLDLPRGRDRRPVRDRDRVYEIDGTHGEMSEWLSSSAAAPLREDISP